MNKQLILIFSFMLFIFSACSSDSHHEEEPTEQTIFMYLPWSGSESTSSSLISYFRQNISDFETVVADGALNNERLLVFLSTSPTTSELFEITYTGNGSTKRTTLNTYTFDTTDFTTAEGITDILNDVQNFAPAHKYAMIIGCHGMGWIPVSLSTRQDALNNFDSDIPPLTRYYGGTISKYRTDISSLKEGIQNAGIGTLDYILFDDCFMANIETAYELKDVTHYLIACPTEIMAYGMPYAEIGKYLIGTPTASKLESISTNFLSFYSSYTDAPYATFSITDCSQLGALAAIMKEINTNHTFDTALRSSLQRMDGYSPVVFYDFGDYVNKLCTDADLLADFEEQLELAVPERYRKHTDYFPSAYNQDGSGQVAAAGLYRHYISTYSGITTSDPSTNTATSTKEQTSWYKATH